MVSLYVCDFPQSLEREDLSSIFKDFDGYVELRTARDRSGQKIAFCDFTDHRSASNAMQNCAGYRFQGSAKGITLRISENSKNGKPNNSTTTDRRPKNQAYDQQLGGRGGQNKQSNQMSSNQPKSILRSSNAYNGQNAQENSSSTPGASHALQSVPNGMGNNSNVVGSTSRSGVANLAGFELPAGMNPNQISQLLLQLRENPDPAIQNQISSVLATLHQIDPDLAAATVSQSAGLPVSTNPVALNQQQVAPASINGYSYGGPPQQQLNSYVNYPQQQSSLIMPANPSVQPVGEIPAHANNANSVPQAAPFEQNQAMRLNQQSLANNPETNTPYDLNQGSGFQAAKQNMQNQSFYSGAASQQQNSGQGHFSQALQSLVDSLNPQKIAVEQSTRKINSLLNQTQQKALASVSKTVYVEGLPADATEREVAHLFRPFPGYKQLRLIPRESKDGQKVFLCFADFETQEQSTTVVNTLQGYRFDKNDIVGLQFSYATRGERGNRSREDKDAGK